MSKMDKNNFYNLFFSSFPNPAFWDLQRWNLIYKVQLFHIVVFDHIVEAFSTIAVFKVF